MTTEERYSEEEGPRTERYAWEVELIAGQYRVIEAHPSQARFFSREDAEEYCINMNQ